MSDGTRDPPQDSAALTLDDASPFRAFDEQYFVESGAWDHLKAILRTNGGAYALAGPRGSGKSWLMLKALSHTERQGGLSLWYPCPSNYSAFDFLSTLSDNFANQIERRYRPDRFYPTLASSPWRVIAGTILVTVGFVLGFRLPASREDLRTAGLVGIGLTIAVSLWWLWPKSRVGPSFRLVRFFGRLREPARDSDRTVTRGATPPPPLLPRLVGVSLLGLTLAYSSLAVYASVDPYLRSDSEAAIRELVLTAAALLVGFALLLVTLRSVAEERKPHRLLTREAGLLRERIRYSSRSKEATEFSAKGGGSGIFGGLKAAREKELVERPTTVASLIHDFRALAERAATVSGRVVIAIDELDKISDAEAVRALLRDVKGVFEVTDVFFLVSVSDEATRSLSLGGVAGRDEFNSSFYTVIDVPPMDASFLAELIARRGALLDPRVAASLALLASSNPRETLRLADPILRAGAANDVDRAVSSVMLGEVRAFRAHAMASTAPGWHDGLTDDERSRLAAILADGRFTPETFTETAGNLLEEWSAEWLGPYWQRHLQDDWRRLIIRINVAAEALNGDASIAELSEILSASDASPVVGRQALTHIRELRESASAPYHNRAGNHLTRP